MTKAEFLEGIRELATDFNHPDSEFSSLLDELENGEEIAAVAEHDPVLSQKFAAIATSIRDLRTYVLSRAEPAGSTETF